MKGDGFDTTLDKADSQTVDLETQHTADQAAISKLEAAGVTDRNTIADLESVGVVDRAVIAQLEADGIIDQGKITHLEIALTSCRRIGAALGVIMAIEKLTEEQAFQVLRQASQDSNRKLRDVADDVLLAGTV